MKRCPECRRDYYDDTLLYCLDDGNALLEGPAGAADTAETALLHSTARPEESRTLISNQSPDTLRQPETAVTQKSRAKRRWAGTFVGGIIVIAAAGFAIYFYRYGVRAAPPISPRENMKFSKLTGSGDAGT